MIIKVAKKDPDFGFISPKTLWTDGSLCLMNRQFDNLLLSLQRH